MEVNELMIGDWVTGKKWRELPFQITCINDSGKFIYGKTVNSTVGPFIVDELEPIPLTTEIFEKNGFDKFLGLGRFVSKYIKNQEVSIMIDVLFCKDSHIVVDIEKQSFVEGTRNSLHSCDIQALHELQHALRLCGLNEFADGFKIEE